MGYGNSWYHVWNQVHPDDNVLWDQAVTQLGLDLRALRALRVQVCSECGKEK